MPPWPSRAWAMAIFADERRLKRTIRFRLIRAMGEGRRGRGASRPNAPATQPWQEGWQLGPARHDRADARQNLHASRPTARTSNPQTSSCPSRMTLRVGCGPSSCTRGTSRSCTTPPSSCFDISGSAPTFGMRRIAEIGYPGMEWRAKMSADRADNSSAGSPGKPAPRWAPKPAPGKFTQKALDMVLQMAHAPGGKPRAQFSRRVGILFHR